jgi:hypothetical protein
MNRATLPEGLESRSTVTLDSDETKKAGNGTDEITWTRRVPNRKPRLSEEE